MEDDDMEYLEAANEDEVSPFSQLRADVLFHAPRFRQ